MNNSRVVGAAGLVLVCLLACCGNADGGAAASSGESSNPRRLPPSELAAVDDLASRFCEILAPCCTGVKMGYTPSNCHYLFKLRADTFDAAKGEACIAAARAYADGPDFCADGSATEIERLCRTAVTDDRGSGLEPAGAPCARDQDCAYPVDGEAVCSEGRCQHRVRGSVGDACGAARDADGSPSLRIAVCEAEDGLHCEPSTNTCAELGAIGASCSVIRQTCVTGSYCVLASRTCVPTQSLGSACEHWYECSAGSFCDERTKVCTALGGVGAPCNDYRECSSGECEQERCAHSLLWATVCDDDF